MGRGGLKSAGKVGAAELSPRGPLQLGFDRSPVLEARRAGVEVVRADLLRAGTYPLNPPMESKEEP